MYYGFLKCETNSDNKVNQTRYYFSCSRKYAFENRIN